MAVYNRGVPISTALDHLWNSIQRNITDSDHPSIDCPTLCSPGMKWMPKVNGTASEWRAFWKFFFEVVQLLVKSRCNNMTLIADMLEFACKMSSDTLFKYNGMYFLMVRVLMSSAEKSCKSVLENTPLKRVVRMDNTEIQRLLHIPYGIAHRYVESRFDVVKESATSGNIGLLDVLLTFGVTTLRPEDSIVEWDYTQDVLRTLFPLDALLQRSPQFFEGSLLWKFDSTLRRRLFLIMRSLEVLPKIRQQPEHADKYIRSLELLFRSIPDPLISVDEVKTNLEKLFRGCVPDVNLESVCKEYKSSFPESCKPVQPRSLKHLARCQVRENMRSLEKCLPSEVNAMPLPKVVKDYIMLKERGHVYQNPIMLTTPHYEGNQISNRTDFLYCVPDNFTG